MATFLPIGVADSSRHTLRNPVHYKYLLVAPNEKTDVRKALESPPAGIRPA